MTEDLPLPYAPQPSILLAANKDAQFLASTQSTLLDLAESALGGHRVARYAPEVGALAAALFYGATIIAASKTLGEEYCALTTATRDASGRFAPVSLRRRAVEVALRVLPPYALQCLGRQQQGRGAVARRQRQRQTNGGDLPSAAPSWAAWVAGWAPRAATLQRIVLWFGAAHTALFLLRGDYSDLTRRLLRTRLLANQPLKGRDVSYRILGVLAVLQLALSTSRGAVGWIAAAHTRRRRARDAAAGGVSAVDAEPIDERVPTAGKEDRAREAGATAAAAANGNGSSAHVPTCVLCLSPWTFPTATPCGHIFCWDCIIRASSFKPECPMCRQPFAARELIVCHGLR